MKPGWTLDDVDWGAFDASKVDPHVLSVIKASAMIELNAPDYVTYLKNVFHDDDLMKEAADQWGKEEQQHGRALGRWVALADPGFDFDDAFRRFTQGYSLPLDTDESVRGSRAAELVARCIVESGTTSFYSAVKDSTNEPVLKQVAGFIAGDEMRHYKLFWDHFNRIDGPSQASFRERLTVAIGRIREADDDDEMGYAYFCANTAPGAAEFDQKLYGGSYEYYAKGLYRPAHINRLVSMTAKAVGVSPQSFIIRMVSRLTYFLFQRRLRSLAWVAD